MSVDEHGTASRLRVPLVLEFSGATVDVVLETSPGTLGGEVLAELAAVAGAKPGVVGYCVRTSREIDVALPIAAAGLRRGDRIVFSSAPPRPTDPSGASSWELVVVGGPAAGRRFPLRGETTVGRDGTASAIGIDDGSLSATHVRFRVVDDGVAVCDAESRNGTAVEGVALPVGEERPIADGAVVRAGRTLLTVERSRPPRQSATPLPDGSVPFNRRPRVTPPFTPRRFALAPPPAAPQRHRIPIAAALMPVLIGVVLYFVLHNVAMLAFVAFAPLMAIGTYVEDWRFGKGRHARETAAFRRRLAELQEELDVVRASEAAARRDGAPPLSELRRRALEQDPRLWERRRDDPDFLLLRLGSASLPSEVSVDYAPGGDEDVRAEADAITSWYGVVPEVPVTASLRELGVLALAGPYARVHELGRGLVLQLATLQSPNDVRVAAGLGEQSAAGWDWVKWLPHATGDEGVGVVSGPVRTLSLLEGLLRLQQERLDASVQRSGAGEPPPAIVLLLDAAVAPERSLLAPLLARGREAGIFVIWLGEHPDELPGDARAIVELDSAAARLVYTETESGIPVTDVTADGLDAALAVDAALALAPLEDVSTVRAAGRIPERVTLLELLGAQRVEGSWVAERWGRASGLGAPIGSGVAGPLTIDLREDGPHGLVGGMTGAGKSELLQTLVASLALDHPPTRLTFLLVDYKGGAAFKDCVSLPHTVGFFTDLDEHLAQRALVSLDAELRRREQVLRQADVHDLMELERIDPDRAPPALVIVIDEFATLVKEVPDFVTGVVDVAQRGRSLGVHLLLATQSPSGVVTKDIRANTNLKIALRVSGPAESADVIDAPDAAAIPRTRPGRALVRTGHAELTPFQTAYVGGETRFGGGGVEVRPFSVAAGDPGDEGAPDDAAADSDLDRIVAACRDAAVRLGLSPPRRPWLEPLPGRVGVETLEQPATPAAVALGLVDDPARQEQRPFVLDLAEAGSVLVYGAGGSGKTTVLRTLACALAARSSVAELNVYCLDFAGHGLRPLDALPHCGSVVPGDDRERVERLFALLRRTIDERKAAFADAGAFTVEDLAGARGAAVPRVLVVLDGYAGFVDAFERVNYGALLEALPRLVADGRPVGVHFAITADRRAVPNALASAAQARLVLRMPSDDDYATFGFDVRATRGLELPLGRGLVDATLEVQTASVSVDPRPEAQLEAIAALAARLREREGAERAPEIRQLPRLVARDELPPASAPMTAVLGVADSTLAPFAVDLAERHLLVAGPYDSGRSTALLTISLGLLASTPGCELHLLAPRRSPLPEHSIWASVARGVEECVARTTELEAALRTRAAGAAPLVVVLDDGEELTDGPAGPVLESIVRRGRDLNGRVVAAAERAAVRAFAGWPRELRKDEYVLLLQPDETDAAALNTVLPRRAGPPFPVGRGYLVSRGSIELVQVAGERASAPSRPA